MATTAGHVGADDHASSGVSLYELARQELLYKADGDEDTGWDKVADMVKANMIADDGTGGDGNDLYSAEVYEALFVSDEPQLYSVSAATEDAWFRS